MQRRFVCVMVLALSGAAACEHKATVESAGALGIPTRAALGDMPDNPMVGKIPADTPYAMVSFRPFPLDVIRKYGAIALPIWTKAMSAMPASSDDATTTIAKDILETANHLDVATVEAEGFTRNARFALYGLGAYPVMRIELGDGNKVFALVQRLAERWHQTLPAPVTRAGGRYWQIDNDKVTVVAAILAKEAVFAAAPKAVIDAQLGVILGEQKPAQAMTQAQLKAIAERDGFSALGIGFADTARIAALAAPEVPSPACGEALAGLVKRVPRIAIGYGELSVDKSSFGLVVELGADALADARSLTGKVAGLDTVLANRPVAAVAAGFDVEKGRIAAGHAATLFADLATRCDLPGMVDATQKAVAWLARPLPPFVGGLHGGYGVMTKLDMAQGAGMPNVEGFGSVQIENAGEVIKLAQTQLPNLVLPTDSKPHPLPAEVVPLHSHAAASDKAIAFAVGPTSEADATRGLGGKPADAPLAMLALDYSRLGASIPMPPDPSGLMSPADLQKMFNALGLLVMQVVVDDRGVVLWTSMSSK